MEINGQVAPDATNEANLTTLPSESAKGITPDNIDGTEIEAAEISAPEKTEIYDKIAEREEYERLIKTRFKNFYTEDTQRMINRRFKHYKALAEKYKALESSLAPERVATHLDDAALIERIRESEVEIASKHKSFSLDEASLSERFMALARYSVESGAISLADAYKLSFFDKLLADERAIAEREIEQRIYGKLRANRARGYENGVLPQSRARSFDASRLSKDERAELARRAANGEKIGF